MTAYEQWSLFFEGGVLLVSFLGLLGVYVQLKLNRRDRTVDSTKQLTALKADHDRRKKQATVEYLGNLRPQWREKWKELSQALGVAPQKPLLEAHVTKVLDTPDLQYAVDDYLGSSSVSIMLSPETVSFDTALSAVWLFARFLRRPLADKCYSDRGVLVVRF